MSPNSNRRSFLKGAGIATLGIAAGMLRCSFEKKQPNIIVFIGDDISWNDVGAYGHPHVKTPNADKMAKEGITFTNAFLTTSSCSPSRCSIMTGRYPHSTGAPELHQPLPADQIVFAGLLKQAGYYTASSGKWHLGKAAEKNFDRIEAGRPSGCENWVKVLSERPKDKPFFMWFAAFDAHRSYEENAIDGPHKPEDVIVPPFLPDNEETRKDLALYYDEISRMDNYMGKVFAELEKQGELENTFLLYMADNGRPFPRCKTTLYASGIQTPFIVKWPGHIKPGFSTDHLVSVIDIAPTLTELAGLENSETFQGHSFANILKNPKNKTRDYIFAEHNWHDYKAHKRAVRSKKYLYIRNAFPELSLSPPADAVRSITYQKMIELYEQDKLTPQQSVCFDTPRSAEELYDVEKDPFEMNNVAADPDYKNVLITMQNALDKWIFQTDDKIPENPTPDNFDRLSGKKWD
jgi:N-sulfoglucosamine sulfohydrolase